MEVDEIKSDNARELERRVAMVRLWSQREGYYIFMINYLLIKVREIFKSMNVMHIQQAHFFISDPALAFFVVLTLLLLLNSLPPKQEIFGFILKIVTEELSGILKKDPKHT